MICVSLAPEGAGQGRFSIRQHRQNQCATRDALRTGHGNFPPGTGLSSRHDSMSSGRGMKILTTGWTRDDTDSIHSPHPACGPPSPRQAGRGPGRGARFHLACLPVFIGG